MSGSNRPPVNRDGTVVRRSAPQRPASVNPDGTVVRRTQSASPPAARPTSTGGDSGGYIYAGSALGTVGYYALKILLILLAAAISLAAAAIYANLRFMLSDAITGYGLLDIISEIVSAFFPLVTLAVSGFVSIRYIVAEMDRYDWPPGFLGLLLALGVAVGVALLLTVVQLALTRWWGILLLIGGGIALGALFED